MSTDDQTDLPMEVGRDCHECGEYVKYADGLEFTFFDVPDECPHCGVEWEGDYGLER